MVWFSLLLFFSFEFSVLLHFSLVIPLGLTADGKANRIKQKIHMCLRSFTSQEGVREKRMNEEKKPAPEYFKSKGNAVYRFRVQITERLIRVERRKRNATKDFTMWNTSGVSTVHLFGLVWFDFGFYLKIEVNGLVKWNRHTDELQTESKCVANPCDFMKKSLNCWLKPVQECCVQLSISCCRHAQGSKWRN